MNKSPRKAEGINAGPTGQSNSGYRDEFSPGMQQERPMYRPVPPPPPPPEQPPCNINRNGATFNPSGYGYRPEPNVNANPGPNPNPNTFPGERYSGYGQGGESRNAGFTEPAVNREESFSYPPPRARSRNNVRARPPKARNPRTPRNRSTGFDIFGGGGHVDTSSLPGIILGIIRSPSEVFQSTRDREWTEAVPVLFISFAIFAIGNFLILGALTSSASSSYPALSALSDLGTLIFVLIESLIFGTIIVLLNGALLHVGASFVGYGDDVTDSIRVAAYSSVPFIVGGIIPLFGIIIAPLWSIILQVIGMRETFSMDQNEAIIAALVPAAVFVIALIILVIWGGDNFSVFGGA